jgi:hypothetical protein
MRVVHHRRLLDTPDLGKRRLEVARVDLVPQARDVQVVARVLAVAVVSL